MARSAVAIVFAAIGVASCATATDTSGLGVVPTSVSIDPGTFLHGVACANVPGAMQSYVATLTDVTDPARPFVVPSSPPVSCAEVMTFREPAVVAGHVYTADIDGYEQNASALAPIGGVFSGTRHMVLVKGGAQVEPRWTGACGTAPASAVVAAANQEHFFEQCTDLDDSGTSPPPEIIVDPSATTRPGGFACTTTDPNGTIASFDVLTDLTPKSAHVACGGSPLVYEAVLPGTYTFTIEARDATGGLVAASHCYAVTSVGLPVYAACDPLTDQGSLLIDPAVLPGLAAHGDATCTAKVSGVKANPSFACKDGVTIAQLDPGLYTVDISPSDAPTTHIKCTATVEDAERATCVP